ncbi:MAG: hypothetical protein NT061_03235, partial [Spirochaetes bacterium]|nr:hypothetical protein [Spirochaetota bacterium]
MALCAMLFLPLALAGAQDQSSLTPPAIPDENAMFGGSGDIVTTIDEQTAAQGVQLVADTKTYPVFTLGGSAGGGVFGQFLPYNPTPSTTDRQWIFGGVTVNSLSVDFLPARDLHFNATLASGVFTTEGASNVSANAYADLRASEFTRLYAAGSFTYKPSTSSIYSTTSQDATLALNEIFVDAAIGRQVFFRIGKQKVSWGVGNWYKPADVLSLAAINPDSPTTATEGPYAVKVDAPFGKLNQATLYVVPPLNGNPEAFSAAAKADVVLGGFELNLGAYGRTDMQSKPRLMAMFTGAVGPFDVYGENVLAYGADRTYVQSDGAGGYTLSTIDDQLVFQSTLGIKYSYSDTNGLSFSTQVQGYYNGAGYQDSSILEKTAARTIIRNNSDYKYGDLVQTGMYYLAGSASVGGQWGEGKNVSDWTLSAYALANFSDNSVRAKPSFAYSYGDQGSKLDMTL